MTSTGSGKGTSFILHAVAHALRARSLTQNFLIDSKMGPK